MYEIIFASVLDDLIWMTLWIIIVLHIIKNKDRRFVISISLVILVSGIVCSFLTNGVLVAMNGKCVLPMILSISICFILLYTCIFIWIALKVCRDEKGITEEERKDCNVMRSIDFVSNEEVKVRRYEVITLSNGIDCIDIWPEDVLKITLWDNSEEKGRVCWSIDPGWISLKQNEREALTIPPVYIKQLEILEYSPARAVKEVSNE